LRPDYLLPVVELGPGIPDDLDLSVEDILRDFLQYIKAGIERHFVDGHANGAGIWQEWAPTMTVVLTTPNGWEGQSQHRMRKAAIDSELVTRGSQIKFVTEAEVSTL
jgi:hypothetical protein